MQLLISNEQSQVPVSEEILAFLQDTVQATLAVEDYQTNVEISMLLVDDDRMAALNEEYRGVADTTDVLSFPMLEEDEALNEPAMSEIPKSEEALLLGDIVISVPRAMEQSVANGQALRDEMSWLTTHAMLHLLGYDHAKADEKAKMRSREALVLNRFGIKRLWLEDDADA